MIYDDQFYEALKQAIERTHLSPKLKEEKKKFVETIRVLDKEGPAAHAKFIQESRYDKGSELLYHTTEIYLTGQEEKEEVRTIKQQAVPMHIEYWNPHKERTNSDEPIIKYMTVEQYLEREIRGLGEAWIFAKKKDLTSEFIKTQMSGGCYEVCSRCIKNWKLQQESRESMDLSCPEGEKQSTIFKVVEHFKGKYVSEHGGMRGELGTLPENLQCYEIFLPWLIKQPFSINGKTPEQMEGEILYVLKESLLMDSFYELKPITLLSSKSEIKNKEEVMGWLQEALIADNQLKEILTLFPEEQHEKIKQLFQLLLIEKTPSLEALEHVKNYAAEKVEADKQLKEILLSHTLGDQDQINRLYQLFLKKKQPPLEALNQAILKLKRQKKEIEIKKEKEEREIGQQIFWGSPRSKTMNPTSDPQLFMVPVLDQANDQSGFGQQSCGYHAIKNALVVNYCLKNNESPYEWLADIGYFNNIVAKISRYVNTSNDDKDISLVPIKTLVEELQKGIFDDPLSIKISSTLTQEGELPPLSIAGFAQFEDTFKYANSGSINLEEAANLYFIATHAQRPLQHTFVLGNSNEEGHWLTLTLMQNEEGRYWIGTNSEENKSDEVLKVKNGLEKLMQDPEAYAHTTYQDAVGEGFERQAHLLEEKDETIKDENYVALIKQEENTFYDLTQAFKFMQRCGWLTPLKSSHHQEKIQHLSQLINFYALYSESKQHQWKELKSALEKTRVSIELQSPKSRHGKKEVIISSSSFKRKPVSKSIKGKKIAHPREESPSLTLSFGLLKDKKETEQVNPTSLVQLQSDDIVSPWHHIKEMIAALRDYSPKGNSRFQLMQLKNLIAQQKNEENKDSCLKDLRSKVEGFDIINDPRVQEVCDKIKNTAPAKSNKKTLY